MKLVVEDLTKEYLDAGGLLTILSGVDHEFPEGRRIAILGSSGVGKSTLLHLLGGLDRPTRGRVRYDDQIISTMTSDQLATFRARHVGFIFQFHHLLPEFSAVENVAMPLIVAGDSDEVAHVRARTLLERVGLSSRAEHRPGQLSGGEQQRVAIARALVARPTVVLADEPTGNLDKKTARQVQELLFEVIAETGSTLIVVTHNQELADVMDQTLEMVAGGTLVARSGNP